MNVETVHASSLRFLCLFFLVSTIIRIFAPVFLSPFKGVPAGRGFKPTQARRARD